jgi:hypothetical protein
VYWRRRALVGTALVVVLAAAGYAAWNATRPTPAPPPPPGCQAGTGAQAVPLDTDQAQIAAIIAGVAARHRLPRQAVVIAYATALQESELQNLHYGDRDSVGVFQQRPSQGWGTTAQLEDPVYATTRFFDALVQVPGYAGLPVDQAAQDVQRSANGTAYQQWAQVAAQLADYFTGDAPHGVSCWYSPGGRADLAGAVRGLAETFGPMGPSGVVEGVTTGRSAHKNGGTVAVVHPRRGAAWTVAGWLVANAQDYGISEVRYGGYQWQAADGTMGWQRAQPGTSPTGGSIVVG